VADLEPYYTARIPADVDRPDAVIGRLTFRQVAIIAGTGLACWLVFTAVHQAAPHLQPLAVAAPLVLLLLIATAIALGARDGITADRYLYAATRHLRRPRLLIHAPNGIPPMPTFLPNAWRKAAARPPAALVMPATGFDDAGVLALREHGHAGLAACSTVNFSLATPGEQTTLVTGFARFLNSLSGPAQILVRTRRIDLTSLVTDLENAAGGLAHPALEHAAREHAAFLADLSTQRQLLARHVLLAVREPPAGKNPTAPGEVAPRITRRLAEAGAALSGASITTTALTAADLGDLLADAAAGPDHLEIR
jgi:hypothetical protein